MEKHEEIKIIFGVVILYSIVTSTFSMLNRIKEIIFQGISMESLKAFLLRNGLWIMAVIVVITIISMINKKYNKEFNSGIMRNHIAILIVGILIVLEGLLNLSSILPLYIVNGIQNIKVSQQIKESIGEILINNIVSHVVSVVIVMCQLLLGVYMIEYGKKVLKQIT